MLVGLSGSGKSTALRSLTDIGYNCIDRIPFELLPHFVEYWNNSTEDYALQMMFTEESEKQKVFNELSQLKSKSFTIFLDSSDEVLLRRYKETRRPHPLQKVYPGKELIELIMLERDLLSDLRGKADHVLDTSNQSPHQLRSSIEQLDGASEELRVTVQSFGFKFGADTDLDLLIDVRFLPNPHFVSELKSLTGQSQEVSDYVFASGDADVVLRKYTDLLAFLIPKYQQEGKRYLKIGVGCTGGKHRSVAIAESLSTVINGLVFCQHRDLERYR